MSTSWLSSYLSSENKEENVGLYVGVCEGHVFSFLFCCYDKMPLKKQLREERPGFSWYSQVTAHHCRKSRQDPEAATHARSQSKEALQCMHASTTQLTLSQTQGTVPPISSYPSAHLVVGVSCSFAALLG